jgi:hypothetical protein
LSNHHAGDFPNFDQSGYVVKWDIKLITIVACKGQRKFNLEMKFCHVERWVKIKSHKWQDFAFFFIIKILKVSRLKQISLLTI